MRNNPEHEPRLVGELQSKSEDLKARKALVRIVELFYHFPSAEITPQQQSEATRRLNRALTIYSELSVTVAEAGIREEDREMLIMGGLKDEALIDQLDPVRVHKEYEIISEGYDLNKEHWNRQLGIDDGNV